jgi:hypothetical protein
VEEGKSERKVEGFYLVPRESGVGVNIGGIKGAKRGQKVTCRDALECLCEPARLQHEKGPSTPLRNGNGRDRRSGGINEGNGNLRYRRALSPTILTLALQVGPNKHL